MSKIKEYLQQLSGAGSLLGSNENFVVHLTKAREKMAIFQKEEPAYCFLKWYQAAVVGKAKEIFFEMDDCHTMIIVFPEELELTTLCQAFDGEQVDLCRRDRLLLEGLLSSTSAKLETSISTAQECHILSAEGLEKQDWWSRLLDQTKGAYKKNSLQIRVKVPDSKQIRARTIKNIQERTRYGPIVCHFALDLSGRPSVVFNEVSLFDKLGIRKSWYSSYTHSDLLLESWASHSPDKGELFRTRTIHEGKRGIGREPNSLVSQPLMRGDLALAVHLNLDGEATLIPVQHGVTLSPMRTEIGCPGATVVFTAQDLDTDLSGFHLRESNALSERINELRLAVKSIVEENLPHFRELSARPEGRIYEQGLLVGGLAGFFLSVKLGLVIQIAAAILTSLLGRLVERHLRKDEIEMSTKTRTVEFRNEILSRLG